MNRKSTLGLQNPTRQSTVTQLNSPDSVTALDLPQFNKTPDQYRICHLAKYYPPMPGGIETHVQALARTQANLGAKVSVLCINGLDEKGYKSTQTKTVQQIDESVEVQRMGRLFSLARFDLCPEFPKHFWKLVSESYDIVHLHTPNPTMLLAWVTMRSRIPLVITHHSDIIKQRILKYALRPLEHLVYSQASRILTDSPKYLEGSKFLRIYKDNLEVLPLGLDCSEHLHPSAAALAYSRCLKEKCGTPIWLSVGRLVYYKALHVAIEALASVPGTLIIVGVGPLEKELKKQAKQLGLENRILWLGRVSEQELIGAYHAATALWFPSNARSEGFGLVQVEAMASGCPVINADIPGSGVSWVSRHEKEGLTVPVNNSNALAQAANRLLKEPNLRNCLATASRERACQFDHMTMAEQSFEIYKQALVSADQSSLFAPRVFRNAAS
jgi:rhamnosyl/mannosyltransferase